MGKYRKRLFNSRRAEVIYARHDTPFALVMRSVSMICIDIDGKNGGLESAAGMVLPPTLAETSKSGNGYHLFYLTEDSWDLHKGFARYADRVGLRKGVDMRSVGCVFHYPTQQWNTRSPAMLPVHLAEEFTKRTTDLEDRITTITTLRESEDPEDKEEFLIMQATIAGRLTAPIPEGKRNNTLFAIGCEMKIAQIPGWEKQVYDRAIELGLDDLEAEKLIKNVRRYG